MTPAAGADWYLIRKAGIRVARSRLLDDCRGFDYGFSTRDGGGAENPDVILAATGLSGRRIHMARQVHGARVVSPSPTGQPPQADGFLVENDCSGPVAGIRTADCVPVMLADPVTGRGAVIHSGWRGTAAGIVPLAVALLAGKGVRSGDMTAALGPAIGSCCYRVGPEVAEAVGGTGVRRSEELFLLDLREAIRMQLEAAGLLSGRISIAPWCTHCEKGLFFSWRRDGSAAGRMLSVLGAAGPP